LRTTFEVDQFRRARLSARAGEYDGLPQLADRFIDLAPQKVNRFRESLATALPFLNRVNGALETDRPMYPLTASLLREYGEPFEALATNIEWAPTDIPTGSGRLVVRLAEEGQPITAPASARGSVEMVLVRSDVYHGHLSTTAGCVVGSNAWLAEVLEGQEGLALTLVAFAVLFAEDFDARVIDICGVEPPPKADILARLTESTGLHLTFGEGDSGATH
jgi:hypothetical protein